MSEWICIDKKTEEVFFYDDMEKMAEECEASAPDIRWQLKRTGRFDSPDQEIVIIPANPEPKE